MVGLMILKQRENLSDERAVEAWVATPDVTFPTAGKLLTKIIKRCRKIASDGPVSPRCGFRRELPGLLLQRFKSNRIIKRIRTMAGEPGDAISLFMAAAAFNFREWMRQLAHLFALIVSCLLPGQQLNPLAKLLSDDENAFFRVD
jgi:hypothetical protein